MNDNKAPGESELPLDSTDEEPQGSVLSDLFVVLVITGNALGLGYLLTVFESRLLSQPKMEPWLMARASGITAYLLLWMLTLAGLLLSHPLKQRIRLFHPITRMRFHTLLAVFTLSFAALHIMTVVLDKFAGVGLVGAFLPFASKYRPLPVALGTLGLYAGLITGVAARFRLGYGPRGWQKVHRFSGLAVILIWIHAIYSGTDSASLAILYLASAFVLIAVALSRYTAVNKGKGGKANIAQSPKKALTSAATSSGETSIRGSSSKRSK